MTTKEEEIRDMLLDFKRWYDKLTPSQKCTVHAPAGSGATSGLYEKSDGRIVNDFIRYKLDNG